MGPGTGRDAARSMAFSSRHAVAASRQRRRLRSVRPRADAPRPRQAQRLADIRPPGGPPEAAKATDESSPVSPAVGLPACGALAARGGRLAAHGRRARRQAATLSRSVHLRSLGIGNRERLAVSVHARAGDYTSDGRLTSLGRGRPAASGRRGGQGPAPSGDPRLPTHAAVDEFLILLGRAIQQFHTYPPTSQICQTRHRGLPAGARLARRPGAAGRSASCRASSSSTKSASARAPSSNRSWRAGSTPPRSPR